METTRLSTQKEPLFPFPFSKGLSEEEFQIFLSRLTEEDVNNIRKAEKEETVRLYDYLFGTLLGKALPARLAVPLATNSSKIKEFILMKKGQSL